MIMSSKVEHQSIMTCFMFSASCLEFNCHSRRGTTSGVICPYCQQIGQLVNLLATAPFEAFLSLLEMFSCQQPPMHLSPKRVVSSLKSFEPRTQVLVGLLANASLNQAGLFS